MLSGCAAGGRGAQIPLAGHYPLVTTCNAGMLAAVPWVDGDLLGMARLEQVGSAGGRSGNRSRARLRCRYPLL